MENRTITFKTPAAMVSTVDVARHTLTVRRNGKVLRVVPITSGKAGFLTRNGTKVVLEKHVLKVMDSATVGIPKGDPDYYHLDVPYALRVTWSGEFVHAAPWSTANQGLANVSHGCVGMSVSNAIWLFNLTHIGDVIKVINSPRIAGARQRLHGLERSVEEVAQGQRARRRRRRNRVRLTRPDLPGLLGSWSSVAHGTAYVAGGGPSRVRVLVVECFGGAGDVACHPTEDDAVERRNRPPVEVAEQAAWVEERPLHEQSCGRRWSVDYRARARPARGRASRPAAAAARPSLDSSTRQKSMISPTYSRFGSRRPRRRPTPPTTRSSRPRTRQASGNEYQPCSPPMPSMTRHRAAGEASNSACSAVDVQAAAGPVGVGGQRVAGRAGCASPTTSGSPRRASLIRCRASSTARSKPSRPSLRDRHVLVDVVLARRRPRAEGLDERPGDASSARA